MIYDIARCRAEAAECERYLRSGGTEMHGALLALSDWRKEEELIRMADLRAPFPWFAGQTEATR